MLLELFFNLLFVVYVPEQKVVSKRKNAESI